MRKLISALALTLALLVTPTLLAQGSGPERWQAYGTGGLAQTSSGTSTTVSSVFDVSGGTSCMAHIVSTSTSSANYDIEGSIDGSTYFYQLARVSNPTSAGEIWIGPCPRFIRFNPSTHASGTLKAYLAWRHMSADPVGSVWKKIDTNGLTTSFTAITATAITDSGLTATRVPYASTGGLLADSAAFTFTVGTGALAATKFVGAFDGGSVTSSTLTSGRCALTSTAGLLIDSSAALCTASLFTLPSLKVSDLTTTRIPFASTAGQLVDVANFTYNSTTGALTLTNGTAPSISTERFLSTGTAPSVANVGVNSCGTTAATIAGKDQAHVITVGATSGTECRVTFATAFANAPVCTVSGETATDLHVVTATGTSTITGTLTAGEKIYEICLGY